MPDIEEGPVRCKVCGRLNDEDDMHVWHTTDCAIVRAALAWAGDGHDVPIAVTDCACDGDCCPDCCPVCAAESMIAPIRSHLQWVENTMEMINAERDLQ